MSKGKEPAAEIEGEYSHSPSRGQIFPEERHRSLRKVSPNVHGTAKVRPHSTYSGWVISKGKGRRVTLSYQLS